ncbi:hypothetical protein L6164_007848 [Bauhinia variegata]|uniref:Uncharacterized protein n=1 Tax=Bauhinia variegata TaxID=167791 RepID=A0ACB9PEN8_BAUVA|nr:hypothetical protein L6164_007848 [Bauhinia variegata]
MELNDSGDELRDSKNPQDSRSGLGIDLNEIPSPSFVETLPDSIDVVRTYHENPAPPPGGPAGIPGDVRGSACASCGKPEVRGHVVVCDGCERGFHLGCAGMRSRQAVKFDEWVCGECVSSGVKSKRWPLGVKSKQLLDINASPPSDVDGEGTEEMQDLRKHTLGDNSFGANPFGAPVTYSNFFNGSAFGFQKASGLVTDAVRVGFDDILNHTQSMARSFKELDVDFPVGKHRNSNNTAIRLPSRSPNEIFLQALRDFISERRGVLEEGWRVEFRQSMSSSELYAVYCAPDGKIFDSVYEVACYLGLMSSYNCMESDIRNERPPSTLDGSHLSRKRKSARAPTVNGFAENKGNFMSYNHKDPSSDGAHVECANTCGNISKAQKIGREDDAHSCPHPCADGLPLQFEDFFVLSLGKVDVRPTYYDVNLIWPIGYRSCWHDKITGSLFTFEVLEGGDSGPVFRIRRRSCSEFPVPVGSVLLSISNLSHFVSQTSEGERKSYDNLDWDDEGSIQMIFSDPCTPTENDVLSCLASCSGDSYDALASDTLQPMANHTSDGLGLIDEIGEILVEERSSSLAWRNISQKLIDVCTEICNQKGTLKFYCNHTENETDFHKLDKKGGKNEIHSTPLSRFCGLPGSVSIPVIIEANNEANSLHEVLGNWLEQDRFGLDVEFVQEIIEQLPEVQCCSQYQFLNNRSNCSSFLTVGNGFLVVEWRGGSQYKEEEVVQSLYRRPKKARMAEGCFKEERCPPPGKVLCSTVACELVGDVFQAWELLGRFHEILGLKEPLSLDELERELVNPWYDGSDFLEKSEKEAEGSQDISSHKVDGTDGPILSSSCNAGPSGSWESPHVFIQVETEAAKEAAQVKLASFTYARCFGVALTKAHNSLLGVLIGELQSKVAALVDPNFDPGETKTKRGRRKDVDNANPSKRTKLNMFPINELTWPEVARRYILAVLSMDCNLDSAEITARESGKVFRCLRGDGGLLCGSLSGVAGMEADALLLAEATKKVFGSLSQENDFLTIEDEVSDAKGACEKTSVTSGDIPEWAKILEPVRKLPTNVGTRIRKCVHEALQKDPPEWARKILEHSISKEVYKGNASGPTKKAVVNLLNEISGGVQQKPDKGRKKKTVISISDIIMKQCRIVLRRAAAADDAKVFCNLLGRKLINSSDNDDEGLLGSPAMVSRPLDFRTIDLRLAAGAYGGSHEAFHEDVRELWGNVRIAFGDQPDSVELADTLSQNFELLYNKEVVTYIQKFLEYAKLDCLTDEVRKEIDDFLASTSEIPKAPWDEGVCKVCGIDRDDDSVLLCDTCDAEYHTYCLNPPLARIPEGNWYCPSCVDGKHTVQDVSEHPYIIGKRQSKKFQGEVTSLYLEALTNLSTVMEEKEYWEYGMGKRTFLLKFLCDEFLNSSLVRQHLEQCAELSAELHQKLRSLSLEWKSLKTKEDFLSAKAAKADTCSLIASGEVVLKEGIAASLSNPGKSLVQPHTACEGPNNCGVFAGNQPTQETNKEKTRFTVVDKSISVTNSDNESHSIDLEGQLKNVCVSADDSKLATNSFSCMDAQSGGKSNKHTSSNHMPQETNGCGRAAQVQGNSQISEGRDTSTLPTYQQGQCVSVDATKSVVNEVESYHLELHAIRHDISQLQDSIANVESQLLKLSVRRDFLGIDSIGRLYWSSAIPGGFSRIVVDASAALLHGRRLTDSGDSVNQSSVMQNYALSGKIAYQASSGFMSQLNNATDFSSPWVAYQCDAEIDELISWLKDNDPKERELKDSVIQWQKSRFQEVSRTVSEDQDEHPEPSSMPRNNEKIVSNSLVTKATSLLERKYGPFFEWDPIEVLKKRGKKAKVTNDEKLYRCECLEPIWSSRQHCMSCHKTFLSDVELEEHDDGKCNAGMPVSEKNRENNGSSKGRGNAKCVTTCENFTGDADTAGTVANGYSNLSSTLIKFSNEESKCPYNFEDICSKFVTEDSNKELVREIGLIVSDGIPSFITSVSPYVSDSTLMQISAQKEGVSHGGGSKDFGTKASEGNTDGNGVCHDYKSNSSPGKLVTNESSKAGKSNRPTMGCSRQRDGNSSFCSPSELEGEHCCVVPLSSLRPIVGKVSHILKQLKISLLDMDAALPEVAFRPSKAQLERRWAWRSFVKSAGTIYEMVQATITLEDMIKTEYLKNDWWYWSSLSAAAKTSTMSSLALRIYSLDSAIVYEKILSNSSLNDSSEPAGIVEPKLLAVLDSEKSKASRKSTRKRKEPDG